MGNLAREYQMSPADCSQSPPLVDRHCAENDRMKVNIWTQPCRRMISGLASRVRLGWEVDSPRYSSGKVLSIAQNAARTSKMFLKGFGASTLRRWLASSRWRAASTTTCSAEARRAMRVSCSRPASLKAVGRPQPLPRTPSFCDSTVGMELRAWQATLISEIWMGALGKQSPVNLIPSRPAKRNCWLTTWLGV